MFQFRFLRIHQKTHALHAMELFCEDMEDSLRTNRGAILAAGLKWKPSASYLEGRPS